ncbi:hypothetical protein HG15A2_04500 [Adhaeretor mobilis]|uniref:Uncharacterized protein n=1 Tax=Adhaeretor mobilis TaxID=1930276 RepID=A0A517MQM6_9BACT|nr:hypothetical protein HG15A2_04500 [Adhaeretor mobilis]
MRDIAKAFRQFTGTDRLVTRIDGGEDSTQKLEHQLRHVSWVVVALTNDENLSVTRGAIRTAHKLGVNVYILIAESLLERAHTDLEHLQFGDAVVQLSANSLRRLIDRSSSKCTVEAVAFARSRGYRNLVVLDGELGPVGVLDGAWVYAHQRVEGAVLRTHAFAGTIVACLTEGFQPGPHVVGLANAAAGLESQGTNWFGPKPLKQLATQPLRHTLPARTLLKKVRRRFALHRAAVLSSAILMGLAIALVVVA